MGWAQHLHPGRLKEGGRVKGTAMTPAQLRGLSSVDMQPGVSGRQYPVHHLVLKRLRRRGLLSYRDGGWHLTRNGRSALRTWRTSLSTSW